MKGVDRGELLEAGLSLFALCGLALAQPLFSLLSDNATFFVVRGSTAGDVILFAVTVALVPPLALLALELAVGAVSARARRVLHVVIVALLAATLALQILKTVIPDASATVLFAFAAGAGVAAAVAYQRLAPFRLGLKFLAPVPVLAAVVFLFFSPVTKIVLPEDSSAATSGESGRDTPVVMVVLDEFDGDSLMGPGRRIDAERFPNFARLAGDAHWFRNATSIADVTEQAVPALLSGREPEEGDLPIQADHPDSLFTMLGASHEMNVTEQITTLCPEDLCGGRSRPAFKERMRSLGSDLRVVWLHHLLPDDLRESLPPIDQSWGDFEGAEDGDGTAAAGTAEQRVADTIDRPGAFRSFTRAINGTAGPPQLSMLHILFPHIPYEYLPSGRQYSNSDVFDGIVFDKWFDRTEALRMEQRYTLQLQALDRLVGQLLDRLHRIGVYDDSLVVVTADHGVSFGDDLHRRTISQANAADIAPVPLFVKLPGERRGRTVDRHVSTLDVVPTIGGVLGVPTPWADGRSLLDSNLDRTRSVTYSTEPRFRKLTLDSGWLDRRRAAAMHSQFARVGTGGRITSEEPGHELIGRAVSDLPVSRDGGDGRAVIDQSDEYPVVDLRSRFLPAFVTGHVAGARSRELIAVALNGRIEAVTRLYTEAQPPSYDALLPEDRFRQGLNRVRVYRVEGGGTSLRLVLLAASPAKVPQQGPRVELEAGSMKGYVERLTAVKGRLEVLGWAVEARTGRPAERVLAYTGRRLLGEVRPSLERPDLSGRYGDAAAARAGFRIVVKTVQARQLVQPGAIRVIAVRGDSADRLKRLP